MTRVSRLQTLIVFVTLIALLLIWGLMALVSASTAQAEGLPATVTTLGITPEKPFVGDRVTAVADGLPRNAVVDLTWETVNGGWVVEESYYFRGKRYTESTLSLGQFHVDANGRLSAPFQVPEDYGGVHNVVATIAGSPDVPVAQGMVDVVQSFEMVPSSGPVGTVIEIRAKGIGWRQMESVWAVNWDNNEVGWVSAADTKGTATARFRASGAIGPHEIKVYTGYMGQAYLNHEQAPTAYLPRPHYVFTVTPGDPPPAAYAEPYQVQPIPQSSFPAGGSLAMSQTQGPVGTQVTLSGSGFVPGSSLSLVWQTMVGSRVTESGFAGQDRPMGQVEVGPDGAFAVPVTIPDDLGGRHTIALLQGSDEVGRTFFAIETSIVGMTPASGPAGTPISIHLKGVGWTEYDNIYTAVYDNAYMGYACGFNSQGDVVINFTAAGTPGVHIIDLYPGIYQGAKDGQQLYRQPQLTYADDHPGNKIPALRFAFTVTES